MDDRLARSRSISPGDILRELTEEHPASRPWRPELAPAAVDTPMQAPASAGPEEFDPDSRDYKAFGRSISRSLPSLRFILKDQSERACCYAHLDSHHPDGCQFLPSLPGKANVIKLRFAGASVAMTVTIEGRHLRPLWELIVGHATPWVHEYPAAMDTEGKGVPVVTAIHFAAEK